MKKTVSVSTLIISLLLSCSSAWVYGQDDDVNTPLSKRMVQSAGVKKGDVVMISGGKHVTALMESTAIAVVKAGGMPTILLDSDRVQRAILKDAPASYLEQVPKYFGEWLKHTNVFISLPEYEDQKAMRADIPQERIAKYQKTNEYFTNILDSLPVRMVGLDYPTRQDAEAVGVEFSQFEKMVFDGIAADHESISKQGARLRGIIQRAKQLRITTPEGTDITFSLATGRSIFLDDGIISDDEAGSGVFNDRIVSLPAGNVYFAPPETSANGKVVIARMRCRYKAMNDTSFEFRQGNLQNFKASTNGDCFEERQKPYSGPKDMFGNVWIGLNPALRVIDQGDSYFRPFNAAGMVYIGIGENRQSGGVNNSNSNFNFPLTNATVTVNGKAVVKDGKLVF